MKMLKNGQKSTWKKSQNLAKNRQKAWAIAHREDYLVEVSNIKHRISLTKLRISDHSLHIETGRYTKPYTESHERICNLCKKEVEDEKHFLLRCEVFNDERAKLISNIEEKIGLKLRFLDENRQFHILINPGKNIQKAVAKFVLNCFQKRMSTLNY